MSRIHSRAQRRQKPRFHGSGAGSWRLSSHCPTDMSKNLPALRKEAPAARACRGTRDWGQGWLGLARLSLPRARACREAPMAARIVKIVQQTHSTANDSMLPEL